MASRALLPPPALPRGESVGVGDAQGSVQGEPAHQLGVHVVDGVAADLPDAGVGFRPAAGDQVGEAAHRPPGLGVQVMSGLDEHPGGVDHPAVAVELVLVGGAVAGSHRHAVGVAGPAGKLPFAWCVAAVQGEQRRQAGPLQPAGVQQPGEEAAGLVEFADAEERGDADAGVAGPDVAVVPVAYAAGILGQRGGRCGDGRPGRRVGQQPQGQQAAHDGLAEGQRRGRSRRSRPASGSRRRRGDPRPPPGPRGPAVRGGPRTARG